MIAIQAKTWNVEDDRTKAEGNYATPRTMKCPKREKRRRKRRRERSSRLAI